MSAAYPTPTAPWPANHVRPPSGSSAETMVLIALILQVIGGVIVVGALTIGLGYTAYHGYSWVWALLIFALIVGTVVAVFLYFAYELSYQRILKGDYEGAKVPTLVIGILSLFLGLVPGIFYLIGYSKLDPAIREQQATYGGWSVAAGAFPTTACRACGRVFPAGAVVFCPACGQRVGP